MRTPKRLLQKWIGIEAVATRLSELDLELHPPQKGIPVVFDEAGNAVPLDTPEGQEVEARLTEAIKKGYDKPE